jgi:hypothetical protein
VLNPEQGNELARLQAELANVKARLERIQTAGSGQIKISEKGAVSVYGLARFPITLYANQWAALFCLTDLIESFIDHNRAKLARKDQ